jgi:hypothetical protein
LSGYIWISPALLVVQAIVGAIEAADVVMDRLLLVGRLREVIAEPSTGSEALTARAQDVSVRGPYKSTDIDSTYTVTSGANPSVAPTAVTQGQLAGKAGRNSYLSGSVLE